MKNFNIGLNMYYLEISCVSPTVFTSSLGVVVFLRTIFQNFSRALIFW